MTLKDPNLTALVKKLAFEWINHAEPDPAESKLIRDKFHKKLEQLDRDFGALCPDEACRISLQNSILSVKYMN